ncbi:hypothetical protein [Bacillus sp. FJAT-45037]|uniref:hypothetical protein n=1 Tax=Bacillus sp. FJAT-45037 TaxID=2011007 RepID=UPI0012FDB846|nr:hypothetical protein [Bacillus sp. FJAT-45037]
MEKLIALCICLGLILSVCQTANDPEVNLEPEQPSVTDQEEQLLEQEKEEIEDEKEEIISTEDQLLGKSDTLLRALETFDWKLIAQHTHEKFGLTFSFFAALGSDERNELHFTKEQVKHLGDGVDYIWGYDNGDQEFKMSPNEYVQNYLFKHHGNRPIVYHQVTYNESVVQSGGILNTIHDNFPEAIYVEYYAEPTEIEMDWQAVRLVYKRADDNWRLTAIVRDIHHP